MVEQFEIPLNQILSWVNGFEMCSNVTFDNLRQPDAQTVSQIYLSLLQGMSLEYRDILEKQIKQILILRTYTLTCSIVNHT